MYDKLKAKRLLKPLDPRPIPNPLPSRFNVDKRCVYHQGLGHETDRCVTLHHSIQDLIDNKVITPPTRPNITNNPLPDHNFGKGLRINCLITEEENKEDPSDLIYDLPECFMMTWEELMDRTFTTAIGYDIWNEIPKLENHQISTNEGRHFKPQVNNQTPTNGGRHFKPQNIDPNDLTKIAHIIGGWGGDTSNPRILIPTT